MKFLAFSSALLLISSPAIAQDLNQALALHICSGDWAAAIADIDGMISQAPAYRSELLAYRSRLLALNSASVPGSGCSAQISQPQIQPEEYKVRYSGSSAPGASSIDAPELQRQTQQLLPNR